VDGVERWYLLTIPERVADRALPVVLDFHGLAEGAEIHTRMSQFSDLAEDEGFVAAFPHGTGTPVGWDLTTGEGNADVRFVRTMLDELGRSMCIDESRVYATGLSMGGMFSSTLACTMADRITAVAPVAGLFEPDHCRPSRAVPLLTYHGTADPFLLFNGGLGSGVGDVLRGQPPKEQPAVPPADLDGPGYPTVAADWARRDGCEGMPDDEAVGSMVIRRVFGCPDQTAVEFVVVEGGGHTWPGSAFSGSLEDLLGPTTGEVDATTETWRFFERFSLG
jgi:polyhydroxybutyrate depolymerase